MQAGLYIAYTGARANEKRMEQVANNLANVSSVGYKQDKVLDAGVLPAVAPSGPDRTASPGEPTGGKLLYSAPAIQYTDYGPGPLRPTGHPTDLAIEGDAFFTIQTKEGIRLSRAGNFRLDAAGDLSTVDGGKLLGDSGPIKVGNAEFVVTDRGEVTVGGAVINKLKLQKPADLTVLKKEGHGLFSFPEGTPLQAAGGNLRIQQGSLEEANVTPMGGMSEVVESSRMFDAYMKMIQTISELNSKASNDLGRV